MDSVTVEMEPVTMEIDSITVVTESVTVEMGFVTVEMEGVTVVTQSITVEMRSVTVVTESVTVELETITVEMRSVTVVTGSVTVEMETISTLPRSIHALRDPRRATVKAVRELPGPIPGVWRRCYDGFDPPPARERQTRRTCARICARFFAFEPVFPAAAIIVSKAPLPRAQAAFVTATSSVVLAFVSRFRLSCFSFRATTRSRISWRGRVWQPAAGRWLPPPFTQRRPGRGKSMDPVGLP